MECEKINIKEEKRERWVGVGWRPLSFSFLTPLTVRMEK